MSGSSSSNSGIQKPFIFSVEGNIGTGKSSFLDMIKNNFSNTQILKEPMDKWTRIGTDVIASPTHNPGGSPCGNNLLDMFYNDPVRWSYTFQTRCSFTKAMQYDHVIDPIVFSERSWLSDRYVFTETLYEMNMMTKIEKEMHNDWFTWLCKKTPPIDAIIYLKASPNVSFDRLINRNRHEEASMNFGYLSIVDKKYNEWLLESSENKIPVLVIDVEEEFINIEHRCKEIIDSVITAFPFLEKYCNTPVGGGRDTNLMLGDDIQHRPSGWTTVRKKKPRYNPVRKLKKTPNWESYHAN